MKVYEGMPKQSNFDFWIENNLNVLFYGKHGVGKTSMIIDAFEKNNLKYKYFSASSMDPWVDFIGVPKQIEDEKGAYLDLVKPKEFRDDEIQAIFFDEFNRSHKKVRNAVMELIQFKSINGCKFPNLRVVWAAINPEDSDSESDLSYDVDKLDPAQKDRFHIHIQIPYKPHKPYFVEKYGKEMSDNAIEWWDSLSSETKDRISPRRLQFALDCFIKGGDLSHILPGDSNVSKLVSNLKFGSPEKEFAKILASKDTEALKNFINKNDVYEDIRPLIIKHKEETIHLLDEEKVVSLISQGTVISRFIFSNFSKFESIINNIAQHSTNRILKNKAKKAIQSNQLQQIKTDPLLREQLMISKILKNAKPNMSVKTRASKFAMNYVEDLNCVNQISITHLPSAKMATVFSNIESCAEETLKKPSNRYLKHRIIISLIGCVNNTLIVDKRELTDKEVNLCLSILEYFSLTCRDTRNIANIFDLINYLYCRLFSLTPNYSSQNFIKSYPGITGNILFKAKKGQSIFYK